MGGDYDAAKANFARASRLAPNAAEPQMNLGLVSLLNKDYRQANQKFGAAAGLEELNDAMGTYYLMTGDATAAVKAFGNAKTNNAALAQLLAKDYSKAKSTLAGITAPNAMTYYLTAILGARTNNDTMVNNNLRQAVKLDRSLAAKAPRTSSSRTSTFRQSSDSSGSRFRLSYSAMVCFIAAASPLRPRRSKP